MNEPRFLRIIPGFGDGPVAEFELPGIMLESDGKPIKVWRYNERSLRITIENSREQCPHWIPELERGLHAMTGRTDHV